MTQRTDKELLELAAKAAGITVIDHEYEGCSGFTYRLSEYQKPIDSFNPLNDDGDAMRLSVNLEATIKHYAHIVEVVAYYNGRAAGLASVDVSSCRYAATRRAIVRAAAEIGAKL